MPAWAAIALSAIVAAVTWLLAAFKGVRDRAMAEQANVDALNEMRRISDQMRGDVDALKQGFAKIEGREEGRRTKL
jgi:hypothetical protein